LDLAIGAYTITATTSETASGLTLADFTVTNGTASALTTVSATVYQITIAPAAQGTSTIQIAANTFQDSARNNNTASNTLSLTYDSTAPTVTLAASVSSPTNSGAYTITATFSEAVTGLTLGDFSVTNATSTGFTALSTTVYQVTITPVNGTTAAISIPATSATDSAGNFNTVSNTLSLTYDATAPSVTLTSSVTSPTNSGAYTITATFSEAVTGVTIGDFSVTNGSAGNFTALSTTVYQVTITPTNGTTAAISLPANSATDSAGNFNTVSNTLSLTYDSTAPSVTLTSSVTSPTNSGAYTITATFSEAVTGVSAADFTVTNGLAGSLVAVSTTVYTVIITPTNGTTSAITFPANSATDTAGNTNTVSNTLSLSYDGAAPTTTDSVRYQPATYATSSGSVRFKVTFSEAMDSSTFNTTDFALTTSGTIAGATVTSVTASGSTQAIVRIAGYTGSGAINLDIAPTATLSDTIGNAMTVFTISGTDESFGVDTTAPALAEVTAVTTPTNDSTPNYTFSSTEAGTITYIGDCSSATTTAIAGNNTVTFTALGDGTHSNCQIQVTDLLGNISTVLNVTSFTVDATAPTTLSSVRFLPSTYATASGSIRFKVTFSKAMDSATFAPTDFALTTSGPIAGATVTNVSASGSTQAIVRVAGYTGSGTINLDIAGTATLSDTLGNAMTVFTISGTDESFGVDTSAPILAEVTPVSTPTNDSTPNYTFSSTEAGTITYIGDCSSATTTATIGNNTITFNALADGTHSNCQIRVTDLLGNQSTLLNISSFSVDTVVPTVTLTSSINSPTNSGAYTVTATFSEAVTGVTVGDFSVTNGSAGSFIALSTTVYQVTITPVNATTAAISLPANSATDSAGNFNTASNTLSIAYDATAPSVTLTSSVTSPTNSGAYTVTATFSEAVTGVTVGDFSVTNGSAGSFIALRACEKIWQLRGGRVQEQAFTTGCGWRAKLRAMLWAMANHVAMDLTFSTPRTMNCPMPRLRACALTHSAVAALCL